MNEQLFLYGVYTIHVRPIELANVRWNAEYEIRESEKPVRKWTTVGGDEGFARVADAIDAAHRAAIAVIEHGDALPKPKAFP
jgi:hypothetical protein